MSFEEQVSKLKFMDHLYSGGLISPRAHLDLNKQVCEEIRAKKEATAPSLLQEIPVLPVTSDPFQNAVGHTFRSAMELLMKKHQDYGPLNISRAPGGALNGLRVRMWDKLARINNLIDSGATPANESLRDSFIDLLNYSAIALLVLDGDWPSLGEK